MNEHPSPSTEQIPQPAWPDCSHLNTLEKLLFWLSIGLGVGGVKRAPGTLGSLWGLPLVWGLQQVSLHPLWLTSSAGVLFLLGIPICAAGMKAYQRKDPGHVVYDEIAAFPIVFLLTPITWTTAIAGFTLFRIFDISKPWPIRRVETLPGAWGVMADDTLAALYAGLILTALHALLIAI